MCAAKMLAAEPEDLVWFQLLRHNIHSHSERMCLLKTCIEII